MAPPIEIIIDADDRVSGKFRNTSTEAKKMAAIIGGAFSGVANSADVALSRYRLRSFHRRWLEPC